MENPELKVCPFCGEEVKFKAVKCRYCKSDLNEDSIKEAEKIKEAMTLEATVPRTNYSVEQLEKPIVSLDNDVELNFVEIDSVEQSKENNKLFAEELLNNSTQENYTKKDSKIKEANMSEFNICPICNNKVKSDLINCRFCYSILNEVRYMEIANKKERINSEKVNLEQERNIERNEKIIQQDEPEKMPLCYNKKSDEADVQKKVAFEWNGCAYEGQVKDGKPDGLGIIKAPDGNSYDGEWLDGMMHGKGKYLWPEGKWYDGEWLANKKHGKGIFVWPDPLGGKYEGDWKDDEMNGHGLIIHTDGSTNEGEFKDGVPHGYGLYASPNGFSYEGEWKDGRKHGRGTLIYKDPTHGFKYVGEWKQNKYHGHGIMYGVDGSVLQEGEWIEGVFQS